MAQFALCRYGVTWLMRTEKGIRKRDPSFACRTAESNKHLPWRRIWGSLDLRLLPASRFGGLDSFSLTFDL